MERFHKDFRKNLLTENSVCDCSEHIFVSDDKSSGLIPRELSGNKKPQILQHLFQSVCIDAAMISAPMIAAALHLGEVQVRKDLADTARPGSNKKGRVRKELIEPQNII